LALEELDDSKRADARVLVDQKRAVHCLSPAALGAAVVGLFLVGDPAQELVHAKRIFHAAIFLEEQIRRLANPKRASEVALEDPCRGGQSLFAVLYLAVFLFAERLVFLY